MALRPPHPQRRDAGAHTLVACEPIGGVAGPEFRARPDHLDAGGLVELVQKCEVVVACCLW